MAPKGLHLLPILLLALLAGGKCADTGSGAKPAFNHILAGTDWPGLSPANSLCATGREQSPVAIEDGHVYPSSEPSPLGIQWNSAVVDFVVNNLGTTVQVNFNGSNILTVPSTIYTPPADSPGLTLAQFHFHTPSEYTLNGEYFPAEVHFVHKDPVTSQLAVIGVWFALHPEDKDNLDLGTFFPSIPEDFNGKSDPIKNTLNLYAMLPQRQSYYHLKGSLTTPPCSENVLWFVMQHPLFISSQQLLTLELALAHGEGSRTNNRPVQDIYERTITLYQGNTLKCGSNSLLPNQCFNAPKTNYVCCPGACPAHPSARPACA